MDSLIFPQWFPHLPPKFSMCALFFTSKCSLYRLFHIIFTQKIPHLPTTDSLTCYLSMFMLSPRNYLRFSPQIFPTCSVLIISFFPQCVHSLLLRFCQVLPPKFSLSTTEYLIFTPIYSLCPLQIALSFTPKIFLPVQYWLALFYSKKFAFSPLNITSPFPSKMPPCSHWHPLTFSYTNSSCVPSQLSQAFS